MKVAVITAYYKESAEVLRRCRESVVSQTVRCRHYMVADGFPQSWVDDQAVAAHLKLPTSHADYGNTPRGLGSLLAASEGADAICFLDADNVIDPDHVKTCLDTGRRNQGCDFIEARRRFVFPDGTPAAIPEEPNHIDTNCYFLLPGSFHLLPHFILQAKALASIGDRLFFALLRTRGMKSARCERETVTYTTNFLPHYRYVDRDAPPSAKELPPFDNIVRWWSGLSEREKEIVRRDVGFRVDFMRGGFTI